MKLDKLIFGRRYKGLKRYKDRHGKPRCYYRPTGHELPNPEAVGFRVFDKAYWEAVGAKGERRAPKPRPATSPEGTVEKAVRAYLAFTESQVAAGKLSKATATFRKSLLGGWAKEHGDKRLGMMTTENVEQGRDNRKATPPTANNWLKAVKGLFAWCIDAKRYGIKENPTLGVKFLKIEATEGFTPWTEPDVAQFIAYWGPDAHGGRVTMEYRALMVLLWSGQRRSDVVAFGWHKLDGDMLQFKQQKTGRRMRLPLPPSLAAVLPPRNVVGMSAPLPFLLNTQGNPFSPTYFTNWFHRACLDAGLDLSPHGTRKLAARRLYRNALRGGRTDALALTMAFTGHKTEKQLRVYIGDDFEQEEYASELVEFMR